MDELYTIHDYKTIEERTMHTIPFINQMIAEGHAGDMILVCEAIQEKELGHIAERIADLEKAKIVLIAGPSSSGKTSTSKRLCIQLMACKKRPFHRGHSRPQPTADKTDPGGKQIQGLCFAAESYLHGRRDMDSDDSQPSVAPH